MAASEFTDQWFTNDGLLVRSDDYNGAAVTLDQVLARGQTLVFNVNGTEFTLDGPLPDEGSIAVGEGVEFYVFLDSVGLYFDMPVVEPLFGLLDGVATVELREGDAVLASTEIAYENHHHLALRPGDVISAELMLTDQFGVEQPAVDATDTTPALIEIGGEWCEPSLALARDFEAYEDALGDMMRALTFMAQDVGGGAMDPVEARNYALRFDLDGPILTGDIVNRIWGAESIPRFVLVDQVTGEVLDAFSGVNMADPGRSAAEHALKLLQDFELDQGALPGLERVGGDGQDLLYGSVRADALRGGGGADMLDSGLGDDLLAGGSGADVLVAGRGDDLLAGQDGHDILRGQAGDDRLRGGEGDDQMAGGGGRDRMFGGEGADHMYGARSHDLLRGGDQADQLYGERGDDRLFGDADNDWLYGGLGDDRLFGGDADDVLNRGAGSDRLTGGAGVDQFDFLTGFGRAVITDFELGGDLLVIDLELAGGRDLAQLTDEARLRGDDLILDLGGDQTIVLKGVDDAAALLETMFAY